MEETALFVDKLSERLYWKGLWQIVGCHGRALSVFIANKRSRGGTRFAFVRVGSKDEALRLIEKLNGLQIHSSGIAVGLAKYDKRSSSTNAQARNVDWRTKKDTSKGIVKCQEEAAQPQDNDVMHDIDDPMNRVPDDPPRVSGEDVSVIPPYFRTFMGAMDVRLTSLSWELRFLRLLLDSYLWRQCIWTPDVTYLLDSTS
ncbi:hypothetical protein F3Y22_tig00113123pilonHSYRG00275 [Hibiscus syriacus]|uniref:RRM domain-containing protein n=1 Tax=Hibiscus syriacus TaxID=106335 RepID=A0A6A2Y0V0_HIBSY|nr:hypothetical protein F3Y22_tig00113123pilonHSYRG00275 [Hibiscus syriacus]